MINKNILLSIIQKYYLDLNDSVKWVVKDENLEIKFMSPSRDVIGKIFYPGFALENCDLAIYDTKKLINLIKICDNDLIIRAEHFNQLFTKLLISDTKYNLTYALSDPLIIKKVGKVNIPKWDIELNLSLNDLTNLIKANKALPESSNMTIEVSPDIVEDYICEFIFGDENNYNNNITYQISGNIKETDIHLPFNSNLFESILNANKDMKEGKLFINKKGLMKLEFKSDDGIQSEYFVVRLAETNF